MNKLPIAMAFLVAATAAPLTQGSGYYGPDGSGYGQGSSARVTLVNAPGGAYIQCDPRNPQSPIRCTPDGW
jgi:hypothetical protein